MDSYFYNYHQSAEDYARHWAKRQETEYHEAPDLDWLIEVLLVILDRPEQILLLKEIRGVIFHSDQVCFDQKVNKYQEDAFEKLAVKVHLPLNSDKNKQPKKMLMTTEGVYVSGGGDHFHIKSVDQANYEMNKQKEVLNLLKDRSRKYEPHSYSSPPKQSNITAYSDPSTMKDSMFGDRDIVIRNNMCTFSCSREERPSCRHLDVIQHFI